MNGPTNHVVKLSVPFRSCKDILTTAVEQGSAYWLSDYDVEVIRDADGLVGAVRVFRPRDRSDLEKCERTLANSSDIANAIARLPRSGVAERVIGEVFGTLCSPDGCCADAEASDVVLQLAIFGKVVFG